MDISYSLEYRRSNPVTIKRYYKTKEEVIDEVTFLILYKDLTYLAIKKNEYKCNNDCCEVSES